MGPRRGRTLGLRAEGTPALVSARSRVVVVFVRSLLLLPRIVGLGLPAVASLLLSSATSRTSCALRASSPATDPCSSSALFLGH